MTIDLNSHMVQSDLYTSSQGGKNRLLTKPPTLSILNVGTIRRHCHIHLPDHTFSSILSVLTCVFTDKSNTDHTVIRTSLDESQKCKTEGHQTVRVHYVDQTFLLSVC